MDGPQACEEEEAKGREGKPVKMLHEHLSRQLGYRDSNGTRTYLEDCTGRVLRSIVAINWNPYYMSCPVGLPSSLHALPGWCT